MCDVIAFYKKNSFYTSGLFNLLPQWHFWDIFQSFLPLKIDWDLMFHLGKHYIYLLFGIWNMHFQCCWKAILWKTYSCFPSFIWLEFYIRLQVFVCNVLFTKRKEICLTGALEMIRQDVLSKHLGGNSQENFRRSLPLYIKILKVGEAW